MWFIIALPITVLCLKWRNMFEAYPDTSNSQILRKTMKNLSQYRRSLSRESSPGPSIRSGMCGKKMNPIWISETGRHWVTYRSFSMKRVAECKNTVPVLRARPTVSCQFLQTKCDSGDVIAVSTEFHEKWGVAVKFPDWFYCKHAYILTAYCEGSPSKYSPWAAEQYCHCWKHFWNFCCGTACNAVSTFFKCLQYPEIFVPLR